MFLVVERGGNKLILENCSSLCRVAKRDPLIFIRKILHTIMFLSFLPLAIFNCMLAFALQPLLIRAGGVSRHQKSSGKLMMRYDSVISKLFRPGFEKVLSDLALEDTQKLYALNRHIEKVNRDSVNKESELAAQLESMKMTKLRKVDEIILEAEKQLNKRIENKFDDICTGSGNTRELLLHFIKVNKGLLPTKVILKYIRNKNFINKTPKSILDLLEMTYQPYSMIAISTICYQLKNFNSNSPGSGDLLKYLINEIQSQRFSFGSQAVGNALYGLQGMSSEYAEVRGVLLALTEKVSGCKDALSPIHIAQVLLGPVNCEFEIAWDPFFSKLLLSVACELDKHGLHDNLVISQSFELIDRKDSSLVKSLADMGLYSTFKDTKAKLQEKVEEQVKAQGKQSPRSAQEKKYLKLAKSAFQSMPSVTVGNNEYLHFFESDIVITTVDANGDKRVVNVEIDGIHHGSSKKKRFCALRDSCLRDKHGIEVFRIDVMSAAEREKSDDDIIRTLQKQLLKK